MTDTEAKALALVNEVAAERGTKYPCVDRRGDARWEALCCAIEAQEAAEARHAAEMRELKERFSEAAAKALYQMRANQLLQASVQPTLAPFIIPAPDPLVEAVGDALEAQGMGRPTHTTPEIAEQLRAAMQARGYEWRKIGEAGE